MWRLEAMLGSPYFPVRGPDSTDYCVTAVLQEVPTGECVLKFRLSEKRAVTGVTDTRREALSF